MKYMTATEIRERFLKYYESKEHFRIPSSSLVPNDPQLLFTIAGMVQFKPIFWGKVKPVHKRVTTCQKCVRTNDIDEVGRTKRHHTFFEMLGNFSFGDYFKEKAIKWAWEFSTVELEMPEEKLWVSVYEEDEEAYAIWRDVIDFPEEKIVRLGKKDNYWGPAGPTGPCGPCSEIFFDTGENPDCPDQEHCSPACDCGRFLEFYNLVFTEFNYNEDGTYTPLSRKNIDTGLGLERLASIIQGVDSNFETDLFKPIIEKTQVLTDMDYNRNKEEMTALRVISDHVRSAVFMISDGVIPTNDGRGYVLKRIIRRALTFGWIHGMKNPFIFKLVEPVVEIMGIQYPELSEKSEIITQIILEEEKKFVRTMEQGLEMIDILLKESKRKNVEKATLSASDAFKLYDTYGFPVEVTREIAGEKGVNVDLAGYRELMNQQRKQARDARGDKEYTKVAKVYEQLNPDSISSIEFIGYDRLSEESRVLFLLKDDKLVDELVEGQIGDIVVRITPFYNEKGGQVSDKGIIYNQLFRAKVQEVFNPYNKVIVHRVRVEKGKLQKGDQVTLEVDNMTRLATAKNHSATHLLHEALKRVLGSHVKQAGSLVSPNRLRFDFCHFKPLSEDEIESIEQLVNEQIMRAMSVNTDIMNLEDAKKSGVIALFDEKYSQTVRVVKMGDFSAELCGGTHVKNTGQIGPFKIKSETGISSGVRRIEGSTGWNTFEMMDEHQKILTQAAAHLNSDPSTLLDSVKKTLEQNKELQRKANELEEKLSRQNIRDILESRIKEIDGIKYLSIIQEDSNQNVMRTVADNAIKKVNGGVICIFNKQAQSVSFIVKVSDDIAGKRLHAGKMAKSISSILGGGGGGRPDFAQAGGKKVENLDQAIEALPEIIKDAST
ncbi:MAG: alanine--tRNA ligase [Thermotogota bacterium]|nr:alanine--tRNA ligase [Thermotogota bacterium]